MAETTISPLRNPVNRNKGEENVKRKRKKRRKKKKSRKKKKENRQNEEDAANMSEDDFKVYVLYLKLSRLCTLFSCYLKYGFKLFRSSYICYIHVFL